MSKKSRKKLAKKAKKKQKSLRTIEADVAQFLDRLYPNEAIRVIGQRDSSDDLDKLKSKTARRKQRRVLVLDEREHLAEMEAIASEIVAGPLVGILFSAAITSVTSGIVVGAIALVSGLVQWWLTPEPERAPQRVDDPKYAPAYSGQIGRVARGQVIPSIFCSVSNDPTGGVLTGGLIIYGKIETRNGSQRAKVRYLISNGTLGAIDKARTKINDQPSGHYSPQTISINTQLGTATQTVPAGYDEYCQNVPVADNNTVNARALGEPKAVGSRFFVDNTAGLQIGVAYSLANLTFYNFTITAIDPATNYITASPPGEFPAGSTIVTWPASGTPTIATIVAGSPPATTNTINVSSDDFEGISSYGEYIAETNSGSIPFRVVNKSRTVDVHGAEIFTLTTDPAVPSSGITMLRSNLVAYYQTTRRTTQLDLNFVAQVWARDSVGSLIDFAQMYQLEMRQHNDAFVPICHFYIRSRNPSALYRSIEIIDLPLAPYAVRISPVFKKKDFSIPLYELVDAGSPNTYSTVNILSTGSLVPKIRIQGFPTTFTLSEINNVVDQAKTRTPDNSPQKPPTLALQSVNEIEANGAASGRSVNLGLPGFACANVEVSFNESIYGQVNVQFFVSEGIQTDKLLAAGSAGAASGGNTLVYPPGFSLAVGGGVKLRNTSKRIESTITAKTLNTITTANSLNWEEGDIWLVTSTHSTCWLPEIYSWLMRDPRFGLSKKITADYFLDWPTLVDNTRWVEGINQHNQSFAWHGIITRSQNIGAWNNEQSRKVMLQSWQGVRKAYEPHRTPINMPAPVLYNSGNAKSVAIQNTVVGLNPVNSYTVTHTRIEPMLGSEYALVVNTVDVTADTWELATGAEDINANTISIPECTSDAQARKTAQLLLNIAKWSGRKALTLDAVSIESMSLRLGHALRVQTYSTNYAAEAEGTVIETSANGFRISQSLSLVRSLTMAANPLGLTDWNADFIIAGVQAGDLVMNLEDNTTATVTGVTKTSLACSPPIPVDTYYQVFDQTTTGLVLAAPEQQPRPFTVTRVADKFWIQVAGVQPEAGDPVAIGKINSFERYFQAIAIEPQLSKTEGKNKRSYSVKITGTNWTPELFDFSRIRVSHRSGVDNPP